MVIRFEGTSGSYCSCPSVCQLPPSSCRCAKSGAPDLAVSLPLLSGPPAPSGGHVPAAVERYDELPTGGQFLLHRGIQRRLRVTGIRERSPETQWSDVRAVIGA